MTHNERVATNPLTGERLIVRDLISNIVDSARFDVLRTLDQESLTPSALQTRGVLSRQTASEYLAQLTTRGLTKPANDQCGYELTAGGKLTLDAIETCLQEIEKENLSCLTRSTHSLQLLRKLAARPSQPRDLAGSNPDSPSRATVQRTLQLFAAQQWSTRKNGSHHLTTTGRRVLDAYEDLALTIEQTMEKAPWLQRLNPARANVPTHALADAKLVVSGPDSPGIVLGAALKLCDPRLDRFRVLTSIFNPTLFRAYDKLLTLGLAGEAIVDESVYTHLHEEGLQHFLDDSEYDNFRISRLEEPLTLGIGLYDDQKVAIGTYNKTGKGDHIAMVLSSNDVLVEWGTELYNSYKDQAFHAVERPAETTESTRITSQLNLHEAH